MRRIGLSLVLALVFSAAVLQAPVHAQARLEYEVTVYNLTRAQVFSPPVFAVHNPDTGIFSAGGVASDALRLLAEDGDPSQLVTLLGMDPDVLSVVSASGPVPPGGKVTLKVTVRGRANRLSGVGMLVTTNDAFFGLDGHEVDFDRLAPNTAVALVPAYDAGTEANNEDCGFIPGPPCGNGGVRALDGAEGFIHVHPGIHGIGDIDAAERDWRNPVAKIVIRKLP